MQTFLPYSDFSLSAKSLDNLRLGKQRVECLQLVNTLLGYSDGHRHHPALKMWSNHTHALIRYGIVICLEWIGRGKNDTVADKLLLKSTLSYDAIFSPDLPLPSWLGNEALHSSHRSNLLRKDEAYYRKHGWSEPTTLAYIWPGPG